MTNQPDTILCPWCGREMEVRVGWHGIPMRWHAWTRCTNKACWAEGATVRGFEAESEEAMEAAQAAALRRYTPPIKPMDFETVSETITSNDAIPLYFEDEDAGEWEINFTLRRLLYTAASDYGKTWRCWERKPTKEEKEAATWEC